MAHSQLAGYLVCFLSSNNPLSLIKNVLISAEVGAHEFVYYCVQVRLSVSSCSPALCSNLLYVLISDARVDLCPLPFTLDPKTETICMSFTLPQQFSTKVKQNESEEDLLRTYLWRCQFLLPLVSLSLVFLSGLVGVCACLCRSFTPTLVVGLFHFIAGLCSLGTVCCFRISVDQLNGEYRKPGDVVGSMGWSLYLALISFPLQMMAAALFLWAARSHRKHYTRITAYRVA
uniref:Claudin domain containing 1 n=1 Tax=Poecilia latipinna TaxID=48699 RepID=A0A3B3UG38_9TELE